MTPISIKIATKKIQLKRKAIIAFTFCAIGALQAQTVFNDSNFFPPVFSNLSAMGYPVLSCDTQVSGRPLLGNGYVNLTTHRLTRLNTNGVYDNSFSWSCQTLNGWNGEINKVLVCPDNKILVGGDFSQPRYALVRLDSNGCEDASFSTTAGFSGPSSINDVKDIALQSDGKIIVGGWFTGMINISTPRRGVVRLNSNGTYDNTFVLSGSQLNNGYNSTLGLYNAPYVQAVSIQSDGKIIAAGNFTNYNTTLVHNIVRLNTDGTLDASFTVNAGSGFNGWVHDVELQSDGKLICVGDFTQYDGNPVNRIVRINQDGSYDPTFNIGGSGFDAIVNTLAIYGNDQIICGGGFISYNGQTEYRIVWLNNDGSRDSTKTFGFGFDAPVYSLKIADGGNATYVGGDFLYSNTVSRTRLAKLKWNCVNSLSTQPIDQYSTIGGIASFVVSSADPNSTYQWQSDTGAGFQNLSNAGQYSGVTTPTLSISNLILSNNTQSFRCVLTNGTCSEISQSAFLYLCATIITQPSNQVLATGSSAVFSAASSDPNATYNWQSDQGFGFMNLSNAGQYSGVNTPSLTVSAVTASNNNQAFRCLILSGSCIDTTSTAYINITTGITENTSSTFTVYPNPANNNITGSWSTADIKTLTLRDAAGRVVRTYNVNGTQAQLSLEGLASGVYFLSVGNCIPCVQKIVKQ